MKIYTQLTDPTVWDEYLSYKKERRHLSRSEEKDLTEYISNKEYINAVSILSGRNASDEHLLIPEKKMISKIETRKKRVVYVYPREVNYILKLLTFLLLRKYDGIFSDSLYSFRVNTGVNKAICRILSTPGLDKMYSYKVDISNYFNSIPIDKMCEKLNAILIDEPEILNILTTLLQDMRVIDDGIIIPESKGVMAGTPFAVFLANVYLMDLDKKMTEDGFIYARYSDDIIVFADNPQRINAAETLILDTLSDYGLSVNEKKESRTVPGEPWSFLGIGYNKGIIDISPISKEKLKAKIRRRARAIKRWQVKKGIDNEKAVKAFIKAMNRKFFDSDSSHELTWARWYFPVINTDVTLSELDRYMQQWIRFLATDRHSKKSFDFSYKDMKKLGYISLVHEWYK